MLVFEKHTAESQSEVREQERDKRDESIDAMTEMLEMEWGRRRSMSAENERLLEVIRQLKEELHEATTHDDLERVVREARSAIEAERGEQARLERLALDLMEPQRRRWFAW